MDPPVGPPGAARRADATSGPAGLASGRVSLSGGRHARLRRANSRLAEDVQMAPCTGDADVI